MIMSFANSNIWPILFVIGAVWFALHPDILIKWEQSRKNKKDIEQFIKLEMRKARIIGYKRTHGINDETKG